MFDPSSILHLLNINLVITKKTEEVEEAYWFGPVHPCVRPSVRLCVTLALRQEPLEIGS